MCWRLSTPRGVSTINKYLSTPWSLRSLIGWVVSQDRDGLEPSRFCRGQKKVVFFVDNQPTNQPITACAPQCRNLFHFIPFIFQKLIDDEEFRPATRSDLWPCITHHKPATSSIHAVTTIISVHAHTHTHSTHTHTHTRKRLRGD